MNPTNLDKLFALLNGATLVDEDVMSYLSYKKPFLRLPATQTKLSRVFDLDGCKVIPIEGEKDEG